MIRLLAIPVAFVALAISAAPASAKMHLEDVSLGVSYLGDDTTEPLITTEQWFWWR
jgi:hypothetical protein